MSYIAAVLIRHADARTDARACAEIYGPFVRYSAVSLEEEPPSAADFAERIERVKRTHPWLIAEDQGAVAGYAYASPHRERRAYRWAADVAVYVAEDRRGQGVGRRLYESLLTLLVEQGIHTACAGITLPNSASVALHEALGFRPVGVYRRIGWKVGQWRDVGWWQAELVPPSAAPPAEPGPPAG